jgi:hypothetical protein
LIKKHYVAFAGNFAYPDQDRQGDFLLKCFGGNTGGSDNAVVMATASGKLLLRADGLHLDEALKRFNALPEGERKPGAVKVEELPGKNRDPLQLQPARGTLVARVYCRAMQPALGGSLQYEQLHNIDGPNIDYLWIHEAEWKSLVPANPKVGVSFPLPPAIADRIVRYHLPVVPDEEAGSWRPEDVRARKLSLTVVEVSPAGIRLRLDGTVLLADDAKIASSRWGHDASLLGFLYFDSTKGEFSRFDIVSLGKAWLIQPNSCPPIPRQRIVGIAIELTSPRTTGDFLPSSVPPEYRREPGYFGKVK